MPCLSIVAIVGRPNVGKSTLFNRIVGRRKAITLDLAGVTRDRHYGTATWEGRDFLLVDTGGLSWGEKGEMEKKVFSQIEMAIREATVILFVADGREGLLPEDRETMRRLHRSGKKVFFVVNKIDGPGEEERLTDFFALGEEVYPVSSEGGYRVNDLLDQVVAHLPSSNSVQPSLAAVKIALVGRPNVGKSSLLNRLLGDVSLTSREAALRGRLHPALPVEGATRAPIEERVIVHEQPGTTRDVIDTPVRVGDRDYLLIDTAGIRRRGTWLSPLERYSVLAALRAIERADICLLLLDAEEGLAKQDAHIAGFIAEARKGILLVWNKWDLVGDSRETRVKFLRTTRSQLRFLAYAPLHFVSAQTGHGCASLWEAVDNLREACRRRIPAEEVEQVFQELIQAHNPPLSKGRPLRFWSVRQTRASPPTFIVFVSDPAGVPSSYQRYLQNGLRKAFPFEGAPLTVLFRKKKRAPR